MSILSQLAANFSALQLRDRAIAVAVGSVILALGGNLLLLKPLQLETDRLRGLDSAHKAEVATALKDLADVDGKLSRGIDVFAKERAIRDDYLKKIAEADAFFSRHDGTGPQVRSLVHSLLEESPGLALVSFKTLPGQVFYTPPAPPPPPKATDQAAEGIAKLAELVVKKSEPAAAVKPPALQKTIYKHGVEITLKGKYSQLVSYMEKLEGYPKRVFWGEARLTVSPYPAAVLKVVIYTLSDQAVQPLD